MVGDIDLRYLRSFLAVAEAGSITQAAARMYLTQQALSRQIASLERALGVALLVRTSRGVLLTAAGKELAAGGETLAASAGVLAERVRCAARGQPGTLRLGMYTESLGGPRLLDIISAFEASHTGTDVVLAGLGVQRNYLDALRNGDVGMLATRLPVSDPDIEVGPVLTREDRVLLVARDDPLARRQSVTPEEFADRAVTDNPAFPREMMDALIPPVTPSGRRYRRRENPSIEDMLLNIAAGRQVHLTVPSFLEYHSHPSVTSVPVSGLPPSQTALVWRAASRSPDIAAFARTAASILSATGPGPGGPG